MLREASGGVIAGVGDLVTMTMHNDEKGDYEMASHVVEYEPDCRIGWEAEGLGPQPARERRMTGISRSVFFS